MRIEWVDGTRELSDRLCLVHYDCWNSVWEAVFQDSETGFASIRCIYCAGLKDVQAFDKGVDQLC